MMEVVLTLSEKEIIELLNTRIALVIHGCALDVVSFAEGDAGEFHVGLAGTDAEKITVSTTRARKLKAKGKSVTPQAERAKKRVVRKKRTTAKKKVAARTKRGRHSRKELADVMRSKTLAGLDVIEKTATKKVAAGSWTEKQLKTLRDGYEARVGAKRIAKDTGKSLGAVYKEAHRLGLTKKQRERASAPSSSPEGWSKKKATKGKAIKWSPAEKEQLRNDWGSKTPAQIAEELGRTEYAVCDRAHMMGLANSRPANERPASWKEERAAYREKRKSQSSWSVEDDVYLREHYPTDGIASCADALGKTGEAVKSRVSRLGIKRVFDAKSLPREKTAHTKWSYEDQLYLRDNWGKKPVKELAADLMRDQQTVSAKAYLMGLSRPSGTMVNREKDQAAIERWRKEIESEQPAVNEEEYPGFDRVKSTDLPLEGRP